MRLEPSMKLLDLKKKFFQPEQSLMPVGRSFPKRKGLVRFFWLRSRRLIDKINLTADNNCRLRLVANKT
jgi:hypothetical protein